MITILNAGNYKVFDGLLIQTLSLVKHTNSPIHMITLTMSLTEINNNFKPITNKASKYLDNILKRKNKESYHTLIDLTQEFKQELCNSVNIKNHFTPYAMLRLLADKINLPEKYIYLDTDTIINQDISSLYNIDISNYEIGAVKDAYRINPKYFNSGVMLINHKMCLKSNLYLKARNIVIKKKLIYADQTALNRVCKNKKMLPIIFNAKDKFYKDIVVHHFCNVRKKFNWFYRIKPWEVIEVKKKMNNYDDILDDYTNRKNQSNWPI